MELVLFLASPTPLWTTDPSTGTHTQNVESYWNRVKQKFKRMKGCHGHQLPSYLDDFMWHGGDSFITFHNIYDKKYSTTISITLKELVQTDLYIFIAYVILCIDYSCDRRVKNLPRFVNNAPVGTFHCLWWFISKVIHRCTRLIQCNNSRKCKGGGVVPLICNEKDYVVPCIRNDPIDAVRPCNVQIGGHRALP